MATIVGSITRAATRLPNEPLNILTFPTHERYESGLAKTGHNFYAFRGQGIKDWNSSYAPLPSNYTLLNPNLGIHQIPPELDFDFILSQNKFGQFPVAHKLSKLLGLPLLSLEHTLPLEQWGAGYINQVKQMRGDLNVFISEFSVSKWGWTTSDSSVRVVHHGIDTDTFSPNAMLVKPKKHVLSVVNDWVNRDVFCGYNLWKTAVAHRNLPTSVVGNTPGLSVAARSVPELVMKYRESEVFLNTSLVSPIPTALLEAMSCGCAVVSTATCMIPEIIEHGKNGFLSATNDPKELADYCHMLLTDNDLRRKLGEAARQTILQKFSMRSFVDNWNKVFAELV